MQSVPVSQRGIRLSDLLPEARFLRCSDIRVTSCCSDPDQLEPGDLFASLATATGGAWANACTALRRGAQAVLCEQPVATNVPVCIVPNARQAYSRICQALAGHPSRRLRVIGVTGTNGKTCVATLIKSVLRAAGQRTEAIGVPGLDDPDSPGSPCRPSFSPPELAQRLALAEADGCSHVVVEVSSQALAEYSAAGVQLDAAVLTNVRRDHLDLHQTVINYRKVKARLFEQLSEQGFAVLNADDLASKFYLNQLVNPVLTVGQQRPAELTASVVERHRSEQTFLIEAGHDTIPVRTRMIGDHHVTNCLLAAGLGLVYGIDLPTIVRGLERVQQVPGRLERIECGQPFSVYVDLGRTPDTLATGLKAVRRVTSGRVICVFGAEGGARQDQRPLLGRVVERSADLGVITNNDPGPEQPLAIAHDILDGYARPARAHILPDREKAIRWALGKARSGDSVLIAGKGNECGQRIGDEVFPCDDRQLVQDWLYQRAREEPAHLRC